MHLRGRLLRRLGLPCRLPPPGVGEGHTGEDGHNELVDILCGRINAGLVSAVVEFDTVDYVADIAAGNARHAITLRRQAVRSAVESGVGT